MIRNSRRTLRNLSNCDFFEQSGRDKGHGKKRANGKIDAGQFINLDEKK